jgi:hypothetical protein
VQGRGPTWAGCGGDLVLSAREAKVARDLPQGGRDGRILPGNPAFSEPRRSPYLPSRGGGLARKIAKLYFSVTVGTVVSLSFFNFYRYNSI